MKLVKHLNQFLLPKFMHDSCCLYQSYRFYSQNVGQNLSPWQNGSMKKSGSNLFYTFTSFTSFRFIQTSSKSFLDQLQACINSNHNSYDKQIMIEKLFSTFLINNEKTSFSYLFSFFNPIYNKLLPIVKDNNFIFNIYKKFNNLDFNRFAEIITLSTISISFSFYFKNCSVTYISSVLGNNIYYNIYFYYKNSYVNYNDFLTKNNIENSIQFGYYLIQLLCQTKYFNTKISNNNQIIIFPTNKTINDINKLLLVQYKDLPMIHKPNLWSLNNYGGFLTNNIIQESLFSINEHKHSTLNNQLFYNTINKINSVQFVINKDLFEFLNNQGQSLLYKGNNHSKIIDQTITLKLAHIYKDQTFYINTFADWRGRIYTYSHYLSYQSSELSSALILFKNGKPLDSKGKYYLYVYTANCYGLNRLTFDQRVDWVKDHQSHIKSMDLDFIKKAKNPILFSSCCLTINKCLQDNNYNVQLPVFLDATCSGIQHISALLMDTNLASLVNLIPNDKVNDIYLYLIDPINKAINNEGKNNPLLNKFIDIKLSREHIKKPIMTFPYSVKVIGITEQLADLFENISKNKEILYKVPTKNGFTYLNRKELFFISNIIYNTIYNQFPGLKNLYNYLDSIVKIMNKLDLPIIWSVASGLTIQQKYMQTIQKKVSISINSKNKKIVLKVPTNKINNIKQRNSIVPNIIHSLDASNIVQLFNSSNLNNKYDIITVHDCFATHPNYIEHMSFQVRLAFVNIYSDSDFLYKFHNNILLLIKQNYSIKNNNIVILNKNNNVQEEIKIPSIPEKGTLDIFKVIYSKYFIN